MNTNSVVDINYMGIEALEDKLSVSFTNLIYYKIDDGEWSLLLGEESTPYISKGSIIYFKGEISPSVPVGIGRFKITKKCNLVGNCMSLLYGDKINNPYLPMKAYSFFGLFRGCDKIINIEDAFLPATTLDERCYTYMFEGCTNLTQVPDLPATTLAESCYSNMFRGCSNLNYIKMLATDISATECLNDWVDGVSSTGTFVKHPEATWDVRGVNGVPEGWTVITDDYPTNSEGMPDSKEFGFPLFLNTEYMTETDDVIVRFRDVKNIIESLASWFFQNTDSYGEVYSDVLYRDRIFIDGYIVTRMYYDQSRDSLMVETQKDYGNDSTIGFLSDGTLFVIIVKQQVGGGVEISFNIDGRDYIAAKGMTWKQWVESSYYNPSYGEFQIYVVENTVYVYAYTGDWFVIGQNGSDFIIEGTRYELYGPVPAPEL